MPKIQDSIFVSVSGEQEVGRWTSIESLRKRLKHSVYLKALTTGEYPKDDPRALLYQTIKEIEFTVKYMMKQFAFWVTHTGIGAPPVRIGISTETIDDVLRTKGNVALAVLSLESTLGLHNYLQEKGEMHLHLPFFLLSPPVDVLAKRLKRRHLDQDQIDIHLKRVKALEAQARASKEVKYVFIENDHSAAVVAERMLKQIRLFRRKPRT